MSSAHEFILKCVQYFAASSHRLYRLCNHLCSSSTLSRCNNMLYVTQVCRAKSPASSCCTSNQQIQYGAGNTWVHVFVTFITTVNVTMFMHVHHQRSKISTWFRNTNLYTLGQEYWCAILSLYRLSWYNWWYHDNDISYIATYMNMD